MVGPAPDLLFGCGLLFALVSVLFSLSGGALFAAMPVAVSGLLVALVSVPHYGATLVRVYDQREDRQAYFWFSIVATAALVLLFGVALVHHYTGSVLATVYLSWAGWHYTGQNYGISAMFVRRRGIELDTSSRRFLHASFTLSYLLVFLDMHSAQAPSADPSLEIRLIPLALPRGLTDLAMPLVGLAYFGCTATAFARLARRAAHFSDLTPVLLIAGVQALWWSIPYSAHYFQLEPGVVPLAWDSRSAFFPWIACGHAIQYLWVTFFYARSSTQWHGQLRYYTAVLLAGAAVWYLPPALFAPGLGAFDWNFALLLAAVINLHHFILDGAIWKLRHWKIARILINDDASRSESQEPAQGWARRLTWCAAGLGLSLLVHSAVERYLIQPAAMRAGDLAAAAASLDRQVWHATTTASDRFLLGRRFEARGDSGQAIAQHEISAGMSNRVEPIRRLIVLYRQVGDATGFVRSCDRLFAFDGVERPLASPSVTTSADSVPREFVEACIQVAQNVSPKALMERQNAAAAARRQGAY